MLRDSAIHELITEAEPRTQAVTPTSARTAQPGILVAPVGLLLSMLGHGAVLAVASILPPPPPSVPVASAPIAFEPFVPPADRVVEAPLPPPPEDVAPAQPPAIEPRPQRRRVARDTAPEPAPAAAPEPAPAPPAPVLTTPARGQGEWAHAPGEPGGVPGGQVGATGTSVGPVAGAGGTGNEGGLSRAELRRILAGYITGTLSRYLDGRIEYPLAARRDQLQGVVLLRVRLARDGRILAVRLSRTSGHPMLDRAALASVQGLGTMPAPPREIPWDEMQELPLPVTYVLH